jgi:hypothetical protein
MAGDRGLAVVILGLIGASFLWKSSAPSGPGMILVQALQRTERADRPRAGQMMSTMTPVLGEAIVLEREIPLHADVEDEIAGPGFDAASEQASDFR